MNRLMILALLLAAAIHGCAGKRTGKNTVNDVIDASHIQYLIDSLFVSTPCFVSQIEMEKILRNISEGDNFLFTDLYPVIDTLVGITKDTTFILAERLEKMGFVYVNGGWGNWAKGPRLRYREYEKDNLQCKITKFYMYNEQMEDGYYNLIAFEHIVCMKPQKQ